jgi:phospholipid-transporting ATPase
VFDTRTPTYVEIVALGETLRYEILNVIEFTSARKRMSVVVRTPEGKIKIFCKGADSVIYERLIPNPIESSDLNQEHTDDFRETTLEHLEIFASDGLRTLCFAAAEIPENVYQVRIFRSCSSFLRIHRSSSLIFYFFPTVVA